MSELNLTDPRELIPLLQRHGFHTRKALGQHFLLSGAALHAIVEACAPEDGLPVLEIGPGIGTVTRALAERGAAVTAIELDSRAIAVLAETVGEFSQVQVVEGDILKLDLGALLGDRCWTVVGNLPYYITTPVISHILEFTEQIRRAVFMVQREVADRMAAVPGGKEYGSLSVFVQVYAEVTRVAKVPRGAFLPPPTVDSAVVRLAIRPEPLVPPALQPDFFRIVRAAFNQRRKTLENALTNANILPRLALAEALIATGIDPKRRGETLSITEYLALTKQISSR